MGNLFKGRLNRTNAFISISLVFVAGIFAGIFSELDFENKFGDSGMIIFFILLTMYALFMISVWIRRWHDLGKSGGYVLLQLIPGIGPLVTLYLLCASGEDKDNQYGKKPGKVKFPGDLLGNS